MNPDVARRSTKIPCFLAPGRDLKNCIHISSLISFVAYGICRQDPSQSAAIPITPPERTPRSSSVRPRNVTKKFRPELPFEESPESPSVVPRSNRFSVKNGHFGSELRCRWAGEFFPFRAIPNSEFVATHEDNRVFMNILIGS